MSGLGRKGPMPKEMPDVLLAVADASVAWWVMKRPVVWSLEAHLGNPLVNCVGDAEIKLAECVAAWCAIQQEPVQ